MNLLVARTRDRALLLRRVFELDPQKWRAIGFNGALVGERFDMIVVVDMPGSLSRFETEKQVRWLHEELPLKLRKGGKMLTP